MKLQHVSSKAVFGVNGLLQDSWKAKELDSVDILKEFNWRIDDERSYVRDRCVPSWNEVLIACLKVLVCICVIR